MQCYACGSELSGQDYCTACGADVGYYKKIRFLSNRLYNEGLDRARVRDLSGAVKCLRQSIRLYKGNIDARNLLGLIYYETGEVVAALTEWVISKNLRDEKNLAGDLLESVQSEPQRLETLGRIARKYNLALGHAEQENYDLAVIQLKRILQLNPNYQRARELLGLLYLRSGEYERAKLECSRCLRIDSGDTLARRYLREAESGLLPTDGRRGRHRAGDEVVRYQSGNETIIQPSRSGAGGGIVSLGAAAVGVALGIAIAWFLILPTRVSRVQQAARQEITSISEEADAKSVQLKNLEQEFAAVNEQLGLMKAQAEEMGETGNSASTDALLRAAAAYLSDPGDIASVYEAFEEIDPDAPEFQKNAGLRGLYQSLTALVGGKLATIFFDDGYTAWRNGDDQTAIRQLHKACTLDSRNEEALYYLGRSYYRSGDTENARETFEQVIVGFPDTELATQAQSALAEINNASVG